MEPRGRGAVGRPGCSSSLEARASLSGVRRRSFSAKAGADGAKLCDFSLAALIVAVTETILAMLDMQGSKQAELPYWHLIIIQNGVKVLQNSPSQVKVSDRGGQYRQIC